MLDWISHTLLWLAYFFLVFLHITLGKYLYEAVKNLRTYVRVCVCVSVCDKGSGRLFEWD